MDRKFTRRNSTEAIVQKFWIKICLKIAWKPIKKHVVLPFKHKRVSIHSSYMSMFTTKCNLNSTCYLRVHRQNSTASLKITRTISARPHVFTTLNGMDWNCLAFIMKSQWMVEGKKSIINFLWYSVYGRPCYFWSKVWLQNLDQKSLNIELRQEELSIQRKWM